MNVKLRPYMSRGQMAYSEIAKETGLDEDFCRSEIERAWQILNPSGDVISCPERLKWELIS